MPYKISEFDGLAIPEYLRRGDTQSIGTGTARPDMIALPGGRFYDNQGSYDSPRQLDPITKRCVVHAVSGSTVRAQMDALRAKIGKRGVLKVLWHDAEERWQDARLTRMRTPRPRGTALEWLPVDLQFTPTQGFWLDLTQTVDDTTFPGATGVSDTVVVNNAGNARAMDVAIEWTIPVTDASYAITIQNTTNGKRFAFSGVNVTTGDVFRIDTATKGAYHMTGEVSISALAKQTTFGTLPSFTCTTGAAHNLAVDDTVRVYDTPAGLWDGFYTVTVIGSATVFDAQMDAQSEIPQTSTSSGSIAKANNLYEETHYFQDRANWFYLMPGDNTIWISTTPDDLDAGTLEFTFYDTYA